MLLEMLLLQGKVNVLFSVGLQSVNVWPLTKLSADKSTAVAARGVESILFVFRDVFQGVCLKLKVLKGRSGSCKSEV
jgi:hypothetical protein